MQPITFTKPPQAPKNTHSLRVTKKSQPASTNLETSLNSITNLCPLGKTIQLMEKLTYI